MLKLLHDVEVVVENAVLLLGHLLQGGHDLARPQFIRIHFFNFPVAGHSFSFEHLSSLVVHRVVLSVPLHPLFDDFGRLQRQDDRLDAAGTGCSVQLLLEA